MEYYSVKEIAELLSVNEETVRRWIRVEKLEAERGSGRQGSKVTSEALTKFLEENKGSMTSLAATTLGLNASKVAGAAILGTAFGGPLTAVGIIAGAFAIIKSKDKDKRTKRLELMEKKIELNNIAVGLKNEIAVKQNELENIEKQLMDLKEITSELDKIEEEKTKI